MMELKQEFTFEAAHFLENYPEDHENQRIHGHSFRVCVAVKGMPDKSSGQIIDMGLFSDILNDTKAKIDHRLLNEIDGLAISTLENICLWLWSQLKPNLPNLFSIEIYRDSLGQSCRYEG